MSEQNIWILEDEEGCRFVYKNILEIRYPIRFFATISELESVLKNYGEPLPHLLIADLRLSDGNLISFLSNPQRRRLIQFPFMVVSSIDDVDALRYCFQSGAADYLVKPFQKSELIVKIERVFSQALMVNHYSALFHEKPAPQLTSKQKKILNAFLQSPLKTASRRDIMALAWGSDRVDPKTIDVHIYNLRKKLESSGIEIQHVGENSWLLLDNRMHQPINVNMSPSNGK